MRPSRYIFPLELLQLDRVQVLWQKQLSLSLTSASAGLRVTDPTSRSF